MRLLAEIWQVLTPRQRRAVLARDGIDFLLHPPIAALGALDFKGGVALIEAGYRPGPEFARPRRRCS